MNAEVLWMMVFESWKFDLIELRSSGDSHRSGIKLLGKEK